MEKGWLPLEANPEVMTQHIKSLGGAQNISFVDIYSYEEWALNMVPRPVYAIVFLYPLTSLLKEKEKSTIDDVKKTGQFLSPNLWHIKQIIPNACGTIALLHAIFNIKTKAPYIQGSFCDQFYNKVLNMNPETKAKELASDKGIQIRHEQVERSGQSSVPSEEEKVIHHFVTYVELDGYIYELDGRKPFPINHGKSSSETFLEDFVDILKKFIDNDPNEMRFTMIALCKDGDSKNL